jgi:hypothetical protein
MTCASGWVDVDGQYMDGCECQDDTWGKSCSAITGLGGIGIGGSVSKTGVLPVSAETNWFSVTFTATTATNFHAKIALTTNPKSEFLFNVYEPTCAGTSMACQDGGQSTARTIWEVSETDTSGTITIYPTVGSGGTVYIEVYRASGSPTCDAYTLTVSD